MILNFTIGKQCCVPLCTNFFLLLYKYVYEFYVLMFAKDTHAGIFNANFLLVNL